MPLKLNVGISKKIGQPDYGSLAASCHVEVELDQALLQADLSSFHDRIQKTFAACRQAVNDELAGSQSDGRRRSHARDSTFVLCVSLSPSFARTGSRAGDSQADQDEDAAGAVSPLFGSHRWPLSAAVRRDSRISRRPGCREVRLPAKLELCVV
jgi:hypothetical protein